MNGLQPLFYALYSDLVRACLVYLVVGTLYYVTFRKRTISILDPFAYSLVFSWMAASSVVLLFVSGEILFKYFFHFVLTQALFYIPVVILGPKLRKRATQEKMLIQNNISVSRVEILFFILCFVVFLCSTIGIYLQYGLPIFLNSRLEIDGGAGGTNILSRLSGPTSLVVQAFSLLILMTQKRRLRLFAALSLAFCTFVVVVNGSKSGIMPYLVWLTLISYFLDVNGYGFAALIRKHIRRLFIIGIVVAFVLVRLKYAETANATWYYLIYRLLITGDGLVMGYVGGVIEKFPDYNWFIALFKGPLGQLGIVSKDSLPPVLGYELFRYYNPWNNDLLGPNSRHNILGIRYFGYWGSFLFSFVAGILVGLSRRGILSFPKVGFLGFTLISIVLIYTATIEADYYLFSGGITNCILVLPGVYVVAWVLSKTARGVNTRA